jgi:hypothetical protein
MTHINIMMLTEPGCRDWKLGSEELGPKLDGIWNNILPGHRLYQELLESPGVGRCQCHHPTRRPVHNGLFECCHGCIFDLDKCENDIKPLRQELNNIPADILVGFVSEQRRNFGEKGISLRDISILKKGNYFSKIIDHENATEVMTDFLAFILILLSSKKSTKYKLAAIEKLERIIRKNENDQANR